MKTTTEWILQTLANLWTILYPTDTIRGIGCDAESFDAVEKVYALKQRPKEKSMVVLFASEEMLAKYGVQLTQQQKEYITHASKPVTLVLSGVQWLAENVYNTDGTLAVRIVSAKEGNKGAERCHGLVSVFGKPIVSTSANLSGQPSPTSFAVIEEHIVHEVDAYLSPDIADSKGEPSQIVRISDDGSIEVLRA